MTSIDALKTRAERWVTPISDAEPAGSGSAGDARFEAVREELAKVGSLAADETPDWRRVVDEGGALLENKSKDLLVASSMAYGMLDQQGLDGLLTGLMVVAELMDRYWEAMEPPLRRIKRRVNAIAWLVDRAQPKLAEIEPKASDRETVAGLVAVGQHLGQVLYAKFEGRAPALAPLRDEFERLEVSLPPDEPPPPPPPPKEPDPPKELEPNTEATPQRVSSGPGGRPKPKPPKPPPPPTPEPPAGPAGISPKEVSKFLRNTGSALLELAGQLREADPSSPTPYRLARVGLWMPYENSPPADAEGKTQVPSPSAAIKAIGPYEASGRWDEVLRDAEANVTGFRFSLDLQHKVAIALENLGYKAALQAVEAELSTFLRRVPTLVDLQDASGTPFASDATKKWIADKVLSGAGGGDGAASPEAAAPAGGTTTVVIDAGEGGEDAAREAALAAEKEGRPEEAVAVLQALATRAMSGKSRFSHRLQVAKVALRAKKLPLARAIFVALDPESQSQPLDQWDPELATDYLSAHLECVRGLMKDDPGLANEAEALYRRLCQVDPASAYRRTP